MNYSSSPITLRVEWRQINANLFDDGAISILWKQHTLLLLAVSVSALLYVALGQEPSVDDSSSIKRGLGVAAAMFLMVGMAQFNDGPLQRPHPAFWRLVFASSVLYWLGLVFLLFQTAARARQLLAGLDPALGVPPVQHTYAERCDIIDADHPSGNVFGNVFEKMDRFVVSHSVGWFVKALILRNAVLCHILSVAFELAEYTLQFHMPNFAECWWDHWVLDVMLCNAIGIQLGSWTCQWLTVKSYRWRGFWNIDSYSGRMRQIAAQLTPYSWMSFDWHMLDDLRHWLCTVLLMSIVMSVEINAFYLKDVLWVPADHVFNIYRLIIVVSAATVAASEGYQFACDRSVRFGQQTWVLIFILVTETLLVFKFGAHLSQRGSPDPLWVYFWLALAAGLVLWTVVYFLVQPLLHKRARRGGLAGPALTVAESRNGGGRLLSLNVECDGDGASDEPKKQN